MNIEFYFDPSCPWCWVTSRWLLEVQTERDITIEWLPFSLALKNGELEGKDVTGHLDTHLIAHKVLRIIEAVHTKEGIDRGVLYSAFGKAYYLDKELLNETFVVAVLEKLGLDKAYSHEGENTAHDKALEGHLENAIGIVGKDVGVPLIIFMNDSGDKQGFFGPVLQGMPSKDEGLKLWDGLSELASSSHFYELKRSRKGGAKPQTTARYFEEYS